MYKFLKLWQPQMEDDLQWKTTSNGRWPQIIKSGISQQPLIGSYSIMKHNLIWPKNILSCFKWWRPLTKDDLKILKREISQQPLIGTNSYCKLKCRLPNYIVVIFQIKKTSDGRRPQNKKSGIDQQLLYGFWLMSS